MVVKMRKVKGIKYIVVGASMLLMTLSGRNLSGDMMIVQAVENVENSDEKVESGGEHECKGEEDGKCYTKAYCTVCNKKCTEEGVIFHQTLYHFEEKKATCTEDGNVEYWYCDGCGKCYEKNEDAVTGTKDILEIKDPIIKASHKLTHVAAKAASKENPGNSEYWYCTACNKYFSDEGKTEIKKDSWLIPYVEKSIEIELGKKVTIDKLMNSTSTFEKMTVENASKYKKYFTVDSKTGTITTKKYYKVKIASSIPVKITAAGKEYTVKVKLVVPAPKITVSRDAIELNGIKGYKYTFKYNAKGASRIKVRVISGPTNSNIKKNLNKIFDSRFIKMKGTVSFTIKKASLKKTKMKFQVTAYYGKNKSKTVVVTEN